MNFEKIIAEARESGMSFEEMAREFTKVLNETSNKEEQNKNTRQNAINSFRNAFDKKYRSTIHVTLEDIAKIVTAASATDTEEGKTWDVNTINDYYNFVLDILESGPEFFKTVNELADMFSDIGLMDIFKVKNDSEHKCTGSCGGNCTCKSNIDKKSAKKDIGIDEAVIRKFLKDLDF